MYLLGGNSEKQVVYSYYMGGDRFAYIDLFMSS